jgi:3'(2'), 5'-bisphosphate nucleotidase
VAVGSSLKFGLIADGQADVYPRLGRTMEWDTAAGHAVLLAAGGEVTDLAGLPLRYGKPGFENPHFVAWGAARPLAFGKSPGLGRGAGF